MANQKPVVVDSPEVSDRKLLVHKQEWLQKVKSSFQTLTQHHWGQLMHINRAAAAKAAGLDETKYASPYTQHKQKVINKSGGYLAGALATLLATALGGLGVFGIVKYLDRPQTPVVKEDDKKPGITPKPYPRGRDVDLGIDVEYQPPK